MKKGIIDKVMSGVKQRKPELLIGAGVMGMVTTTCMAVSATPKALSLMEDKKSELGVTILTKKESVQAAWRVYVPSVILGSLSIGCIVAGTSSSLKRTSAIATAYAISENTLKTYQDKIVEVCGEEKAKEIKQEVVKETSKQRPVIVEEAESFITATGNGQTLFYDSLTGRYFRSSTNAVEKAINDTNKMMISENYVTVNDLYMEIGIPTVVAGDILGWSVDRESIEVSYDSDIEVDGQPYIIIDFTNKPMPLKTRCGW